MEWDFDIAKEKFGIFSTMFENKINKNYIKL